MKRVGVEAVPPVRVIVDGTEQPDATIHLVNDRQEHAVEIQIAGTTVAKSIPTEMEVR